MMRFVISGCACRGEFGAAGYLTGGESATCMQTHHPPRGPWLCKSPVGVLRRRFVGSHLRLPITPGRGERRRRCLNAAPGWSESFKIKFGSRQQFFLVQDPPAARCRPQQPNFSTFCNPVETDVKGDTCKRRAAHTLVPMRLLSCWSDAGIHRLQRTGRTGMRRGGAVRTAGGGRRRQGERGTSYLWEVCRFSLLQM